ncbi:MAG: alcohol dehydrogenase catalytic domain-containing protein [Deltaproteobacteria bacterium]|nr:alcohol dehydrogenase catalytic domain-containing protein [Deltaproteobacteria bacterium]
MRVLMYYSNNDVRVEEMPVPQIGPGEILMKVISSGICGSDVMEWYRRDKVPLVLGHEVAGEVVEVGKGVEKFKPGDRITATHHVPCNTCHYCLSGHHTMCEMLLKGTRFYPGGFAEYVRIPSVNVDRGVFTIPEGVSFDRASFMEPLGCVLRAQRNAKLRPGQSVLVLGSGISGLLHVGVARSMGAGLVVAADTIDYRLEKAREMGAHVVARADDSVAEIVRENNDGYLADVVIICYEGFIPLALRCVERGGTVLFFAGASEDAKIPNTINSIFWRTEVTLASSYGAAPVDCDLALKLIKANAVAVEKMISHRLSMEEATEAFGAVCLPTKHQCIKVIVKPHQ